MELNENHTPTDGPLWTNRNFCLLFAAQVVSLLGSGVTTVALALFAYELVGGRSATAVVGTALMLRILAFLIFSQPAGVLADRVNRKHMLVAADVLRFGLLALFPFVTEVWQVYTLIFLVNAATAFFTPTFEASIPDVVGVQHYVKALALSRVAVDVEAFAAPALTGVLVAILDVRWVFWFDSLTYLASAALVLAAALPHIKRQHNPLVWRTFATEISHGTRVLLREASLRRALVLSMAEATAGAAAIVVTVTYVREVLGSGETAFSLIMAALGFGSGLAAFALSRGTARYERGADEGLSLHSRRHRWTHLALLSGGLVLGLLLLPGVLRPPLLLFGVLWALNGVGQALIAVASSTLLAEHTRPEERGRAYAAHFALTHACWLVTYPAVGYASATWGAPATFSVAGLICLAITAVAMLVGRTPQRPHVHRPEDSAQLRAHHAPESEATTGATGFNFTITQ